MPKNLVFLQAHLQERLSASRSTQNPLFASLENLNLSASPHLYPTKWSRVEMSQEEKMFYIYMKQSLLYNNICWNIVIVALLYLGQILYQCFHSNQTIYMSSRTIRGKQSSYHITSLAPEALKWLTLLDS